MIVGIIIENIVYNYLNEMRFGFVAQKVYQQRVGVGDGVNVSVR